MIGAQRCCCSRGGAAAAASASSRAGRRFAAAASAAARPPALVASAAAAASSRGSRRFASSVKAAAASTDRPQVLITGANTGIGLETAKDLAKKGFDVTLACRDDAKAAAAAEAVRAHARSGPGSDVQTLRLDLASLASCRDAANAFLDSGRRLDVLVANAGVMAPPTRLQTADGFELQIGTNHLGHFAFAGRVFPALRRKEAPAAAGDLPVAVAKRLVVVSSSAHLIPGMDLEDLNWERRDYKAWPAYGSSKLANLLWSYELARRLPSPAATTTGAGGDQSAAAAASKAPLSVNALMPGVVRTELSRYIMPNRESLGARIMALLTLPITLDPVAGAATSIRLASDPELEGVTGKYYDVYRSGAKPGGSPVPSAGSPSSYDEAAAKRLWQLSEELTGVAFEV